LTQPLVSVKVPETSAVPFPMKTVIKILLPGLSSLALAGLPLLIAEPARAINVSVGGSSWDVQTFTGSYTSESSQFNQSIMPWWND
jgi:hypothetical protein